MVEHMRHLRLNGRGRGTMPTGWGMNPRWMKCVVAQGAYKKHKAAGGDGIPAELLKYLGGTGVQVLTHLFNAVLATRCVPSAWRKGIAVHLARGGDRGDCSNYRPLTPLAIIDKLFAKLLSDRISHVVCLHDQQYAFRSGRPQRWPRHTKSVTQPAGSRPATNSG